MTKIRKVVSINDKIWPLSANFENIHQDYMWVAKFRNCIKNIQIIKSVHIIFADFLVYFIWRSKAHNFCLYRGLTEISMVLPYYEKLWIFRVLRIQLWKPFLLKIQTQLSLISQISMIFTEYLRWGGEWINFGGNSWILSKFLSCCRFC